MAHIFAHLTATVVKADTGDTEDGWVDPRWSMTVLHPSRNDVRPVVDCDESDPDLLDYVSEALAELGAVEDERDGTFHAIDARQDFRTGDEWHYTLHFTSKDAAYGYRETPWYPFDR